MEIRFRKVSDQAHEVSVLRADGTSERKTLSSRSFLFHDLAHFVLESQVPIRNGFWGAIAGGCSIFAADLESPALMQAERMAGPLQILIRDNACRERYAELMSRYLNEDVADRAADQIYDLVREIRGRWMATPRGGDMCLLWKEEEDDAEHGDEPGV